MSSIQTLDNISLEISEQKKLSSSDLKGKNVILFFYPKDNTPGCTRESCGFRDLHKKFQQLDTVIIGISRDSFKSHEKFKSNHDLPFDLVADAKEDLCKLFDVIKMKNRYGKQVRGIERSTFLYDKKGKLKQEWRNVKVDGHVEELLNVVKTMEKNNVTA